MIVLRGSLCIAMVAAISLAPSRSDARRHRTGDEESERPKRVRLYHVGDDVPAGHHVETRPRAGLAAVGAGLFTVPYLITTYFSLRSNDPDARWALVPVFGPTLYLIADPPRGGDLSGYGTAFLLLDSAMQATGLTLFIIGTSTNMTVIARDDVARVRVLPSCGATSCALQAIGTF